MLKKLILDEMINKDFDPKTLIGKSYTDFNVSYTIRDNGYIRYILWDEYTNDEDSSWIIKYIQGIKDNRIILIVGSGSLIKNAFIG